jgi:micrococcal nuclease
MTLDFCKFKRTASVTSINESIVPDASRTHSSYFLAKVTDVYDGDTFTCDIHLFDKIWLIDEKVRLYGINAPEMHGESKARGTLSRDALADKIKGREIYVKVDSTHPREKYGRLLGTIFLQEADTESINGWMIKEKLAIRYME